MSGPCDTCAYRPGAEANTEAYNRFRSLICALTGVPFYCHHNFDWKTQRSRMTRPEFRKLRPTLCEGWRREVKKHVKPGLAGTFNRLVRRWKGEYILLLIEEWVGAEGADKKARTKELQAAIKSLHAEDGYFEIEREKENG
jgi:hypothetical protein